MELNRLFPCLFSLFTAIILLSGCGGATGTCAINCVDTNGNHDVGPYYNETESSCETERANAQTELAAWQGVCTATFTAN